VAAVTAEASRFSIQTTTTWEIADEPVPAGVEDGRGDGAAVSLAVGAGVADGPAACVDDGRADAVGRGALVARTLGALADGGAPAEPADVADAPADGVPTAAGLPADGLPADEPENEAAVVADAARLAGGGVAWHAARRAASPRIAAARVSRRRSDRPSAIARSR
jgi:hypothetical protein